MSRLRAWIAFLLLALSAKAQPKRIVSTFPSVTETLFALGAGDRVVGVSIYCRYPPAVLALPKIGTFLKPDPEKIALLRPDLVIIQQSATTLAGRLSALGIRYIEVKIGTLTDIYSMIRDIGQAVGLPQNANKIEAGIRSRLDSIRAEARSNSPPTVLIVIGRHPGTLTNLVAAGPGTYLGELLEIAGGKNVLRDKAIAFPRISLETVLRLNPDVILDASMMSDIGTDERRREALLQEPWLAVRELAAVQQRRVFGITSDSLTAPGPRVVDAVELIRTKIQQQDHHP